MKIPAIGNVSLKSTLSRNFMSILSSTVIYSFCAWGVLVILAKLGNPKIVGQYTLGLAIGGPITMFFMMQLRAIFVTDQKGRYTFAEYIGFRTLTSIAAVVIVAVLVLFLRYEKMTSVIIIAVTAAKAIEAIDDIIYGLIQKYEQMYYIAISRIIRGLLTLGLVALIMYFTRSILNVVIGYALCWFGILIFYDRRIAGKYAKSTPVFKVTAFRKLLRMALPLGIVSILMSANIRFGHIVISKYFNEEAVGFYSAMNFVITGADAAMLSLGFAVMPRLSKAFQDNIGYYVSLVKKILLIAAGAGVCIFAGIFFFGKLFLTIFYGMEYAENYPVFVIFGAIIIIMFINSMLLCAITAARKFIIQIPLFASVFLCTVIGSFLLIPNYYLKGAAISVGISYIVRLVFSSVVVIMIIRKAITVRKLG